MTGTFSFVKDIKSILKNSLRCSQKKKVFQKMSIDFQRQKKKKKKDFEDSQKEEKDFQSIPTNKKKIFIEFSQIKEDFKALRLGEKS